MADVSLVNHGPASGISQVVSTAVASTKGRMAAWRQQLPVVEGFEDELKSLQDDDLRKRSLSLRFRARSGERLDQLAPEAFALVREAGRRTLEMRHFDVQILGGFSLFHGSIAEMETGEGKTLTATLPMYLHALHGKGTHLATVNDYLAKRDAEWMSPIYQALGLTVGVIQTGMNQEQRRRAYGCDVTYGTAKEFGFDFLRDRLLIRRQREQVDRVNVLGNGQSGGEQPVHRHMHFALVDEADSILIDEGRTPLIISAMPGEAQYMAVACYEWAASCAHEFEEDRDYEYDHEKKKVELTLAGRHLCRTLPKPESMGPVGLIDIYSYVERAVKVAREYQRDREFVVRNGEVVIVDEFTGRLAEGRKWSGGIHQAVEAMEGVKVTVESGHAARITVQDYFRRYRHLSGMTGTAASSARELKKIYKTPYVRIPTNRPSQREILPDLVYLSAEDKWMAIAERIKELNSMGRPVLVGTRSIDKSERLSALLNEAGIQHEILNARHIAREAEIVSQAGQYGRVTVATNMAGRGTDIKLGEGIAELGGLHVICTELHDAARIDRQLIGRCGRQGDPGTGQFYLSVEDDIITAAYGHRKSPKVRRSMAAQRNLNQLSRKFRRAQRNVERRHFRGRKILLHHEKHRQKMHIEMGQDPYLDMPDQ